MITKTKEKEIAIKLRKDGSTYSEILRQVHVAKSTLGLWFKEVKLSQPQIQRITEKKLLAAKRGAEKVRSDRIKRTADIIEKSRNQIKYISKRELWLIGIALYWAEGSKEKDYRPGNGLKFSNSDPEMIKLFLKWVDEVLNVEKERIDCEIYVHENHKDRIFLIKKFWSKQIGMPVSMFKKIYFKRQNIKTIRKNIGDSYFGLLRINIRKSNILQRKTRGWIRGMIECDL